MYNGSKGGLIMDKKYGYEYNKKYVEKYMEKIEDIKVRVRAGGRDAIKAVATQQGVSLNAYIKQAVRDKIKADTGEDIEL